MNLNPFFNSADNGKQTAGTENRTALVSDIVNIKSERNNELKPLNLALDKATADCVELTAKLEAAKIRERTANSKLRQAKGVYSIQVTRIEKELMATAPESIDIFCAELQEEMRELRNKGVSKSLNKTNAISLTLRIESMRKAIDKAGKLKLLAVTDLDNRLKSLRASIPALYMQ